VSDYLASVLSTRDYSKAISSRGRYEVPIGRTSLSHARLAMFKKGNPSRVTAIGGGVEGRIQERLIDFHAKLQQVNQGAWLG